MRFRPLHDILLRVKRIVFRKQFRSRLSEKLMDLGNLVAIALVFGQFISDKQFSTSLLAVGIAATIIFYIASYIVDL